MEWWYVQCPLHGCPADMFFSSENACWAWLQYHLMSSTSGLVPHPGNDLEAMRKAMHDSVVRKLTDTEVQQWSDWQKEKTEKGKSSSNVEMPELYEDKEEETESKNNRRSSLEVNIHQLHRHRHELQRGQGLNRHLPHQKSSTRGSSTRPK